MPNEETKLGDVNATLKDVELELLKRKVDRQDEVISQLTADDEGAAGDPAHDPAADGAAGEEPAPPPAE